MPNWCFTQYAIHGDSEQVKDLHDRMTKIASMQEPLIPNGFGPNWLGCLVKDLGGNPNAVYCRGTFKEVKLSEDGTVLTFDTEHAWSRPEEVEELILAFYPESTMSLYFIEEELGMEIFQTNDESGQFFPQQVIIDQEEEGMEYFTMEEALKKMTELAGKPIGDYETAQQFCEQHNNEEDETEGEKHIWIHKADLIY